MTKLVRKGRPRILRYSEARYLLRDIFIFYKDKHAFRLYGFCFLPDRVHVVMAVATERVLKTAMTEMWRLVRVKVSRRYCLRGVVFRPVYLAEVLADPPAVRRALVYIHDQPILRGLQQPACQAPITSAAAYRKGLGTGWWSCTRFIDLGSGRISARRNGSSTWQ